jgi:hypothetical protein
VRAIKSAPPPGAAGTSIFIGLSGYSLAKAPPKVCINTRKNPKIPVKELDLIDALS